MRISVTPRKGSQLNEGVVKEMNRYDGGYAFIEKGNIVEKYTDALADLTHYDYVIVESSRITVDRWKSFGLNVEELPRGAFGIGQVVNSIVGDDISQEKGFKVINRKGPYYWLESLETGEIFEGVDATKVSMR